MCRHLKLTLVIVAALAVVGTAVMLALPAKGPSSQAANAPTSRGEHAPAIPAMELPKRARPAVAIVGRTGCTGTAV